MNGTRYIPGPWAVVVAPQGLAVLGGDVPAEVLSRVWDRLSAGGGLGSVLESLTGAFGTSLAAIPPFAVALTEGDAVRVAVRGELAVHLEADVDDTVTGAGVTTWSERVITGVRALDVSLPASTEVVPAGVVPADVEAGSAVSGAAAAERAEPSAAAWFPIAGGIVLASAVRVELITASVPAAGIDIPDLPPAPSVLPVPTEASAPAAPPAPAATPAPHAQPMPPVTPNAAPHLTPMPPVTPDSAQPASPAQPMPHVPPVTSDAVRAPTGAAPAPAAAAPGLIDSAAVFSATDGDTWMPMDSTLAHSTDRVPEAEPASTPAATASAPDVPPTPRSHAGSASDTESAPELAGEYDDMWGATIARPAEDTTVRAGEPAHGEPASRESDGEPAPGEPASGEPAPGEPAPGESAPSEPAPSEPAPASSPTPALIEVPVAPPSTPLEGDHDGATISVAQARALRDSAAGAPATPGTPAAPAAPAAPAGAADSDAPPTPPTPTAADSAPAAAPTPSPTTALGTIRLSTGQSVVLDRTVVIGRRPRSTRVSGTELPHLIAVDSPEQDISRSHVEIRPEGDSVVVIDLHTTNGTTLLRSGIEPVRLHPGEHTVVVSGDVIDLGDGITVAFEDLP